MDKIFMWVAKRSGASISVSGFDAAGAAVKVSGVDRIEAGKNGVGPTVIDKSGKSYELVSN